MHPLRGLAIVTCTTLFLLGAVGWMLPVSVDADTNVASTRVECGSILRPAAIAPASATAIDVRCHDARRFRGILGAVGMGAGIVGLGLAIGVESSRVSRTEPQLRLITNRELEAEGDEFLLTTRRHDRAMNEPVGRSR